MSASTQLASASTMDRLSLYMGTCCRIWIGLYLALCCLASVTSMMLHVAAVGLLLCILSYFRLPAPEPGEVFRILGKFFLIYVQKYSCICTYIYNYWHDCRDLFTRINYIEAPLIYDIVPQSRDIVEQGTNSIGHTA